MVASADRVGTPTTIRSGRRVSSTARPSRRNSGFHATSTASPAGARRRSSATSRAVVPGGTVDLPTISAGPVRCGASAATAPNTWDRSYPEWSGRPGVPTPRKCTVPKRAASSKLVVNASRPVLVCRASRSSRSGSRNQARPALQQRHLVRFDVDAEHLVPELGHARGVRGTQVPASDHRQPHASDGTGAAWMRGFGVVNGTGRAAVGRLSPAIGALPGRNATRQRCAATGHEHSVIIVTTYTRLDEYWGRRGSFGSRGAPFGTR